RDDLWADVRRLNVAVALPWRRGIDATIGAQPLHVYFPTEDDLGRSLLVHGDFYVHSNRRRIEDKEAGGEVSRLVAGKAASLAAELAASVAKQGNPLLLALAERSHADGFGEVMGEMLDAELR